MLNKYIELWDVLLYHEEIYQAVRGEMIEEAYELLITIQ